MSRMEKHLGKKRKCISGKVYEEDNGVELQKMRHGEKANLRYKGKCSHRTQLGTESAGKVVNFLQINFIVNYTGCVMVGNNAGRCNARALT